LEDGSRRVISIQEVDGMEGEVITLSEIFKFSRRGVDEKGVVLGQYCSTGIIPKCVSNMKQRGLKTDLAIFSHNID
jgi:pilus assembly protein CpaF